MKERNIIHIASCLTGVSGLLFSKFPLVETTITGTIQMGMIIALGKEVDILSSNKYIIGIVGGMATIPLKKGLLNLLLPYLPLGNVLNTGINIASTELLGWLVLSQLKVIKNERDKSRELGKFQVSYVYENYKNNLKNIRNNPRYFDILMELVIYIYGEESKEIQSYYYYNELVIALPHNKEYISIEHVQLSNTLHKIKELSSKEIADIHQFTQIVFDKVSRDFKVGLRALECLREVQNIYCKD